MNLPPLVETFVLHFGEMGGRWGVNRAVGQIYALLFVSDRALNAEEITAALGISRSNTSIALKELDAWRLVRRRHRPGDRRDYFEAPEDVWQILRTLVEERRRREIDPTLSLLRDILLEAPASAEERHAQARMGEMLELMELATRWATDLQRLDNSSLRQLLALGSGVTKLLELKNKVPIFGSGSRRDEAKESA